MFAIRYCTLSGAEHVVVSGDRDQTAAKAGQILYAALKGGHKLSYLTIVNCRKRPGTKPVFRLSRDNLSEDELRKYCKLFHRKAFASA